MKFRAPRRCPGDSTRPPPDEAGVFHCPKSDTEERNGNPDERAVSGIAPDGRQAAGGGQGSSTPSPTWSATATASMSSATATAGSRWTSPSGCTGRNGLPSRSRAATTRCRPRGSGSSCGRTGSGQRSPSPVEEVADGAIEMRSAIIEATGYKNFIAAVLAVSRHGARQADRKRCPADCLRAHGLGPGRAGGKAWSASRSWRSSAGLPCPGSRRTSGNCSTSCNPPGRRPRTARARSQCPRRAWPRRPDGRHPARREPPRPHVGAGGSAAWIGREHIGFGRLLELMEFWIHGNPTCTMQGVAECRTPEEIRRGTPAADEG